MSDEWYYARDNQKYGPFSPAQLKQLAASGQLQPTDMVHRAGMQKWMPAAQVKGLFTVPPPVGEAGTTLAVPPPVPPRVPPLPPPVPPVPPPVPLDDLAEPTPTVRTGGKKAKRGNRLVWVGVGGGVTATMVLLAILMFGRKDGSTPGITKVDLARGPNGEKIAEFEEGKMQFLGFVDNKGKSVPHGRCTVYYDKIGGIKREVSDCYNGSYHGKLSVYSREGRIECERTYDKDIPVGTHKGYGEDGKLVWELHFVDGKPRIGEVDCFCMVCQIAFLYRTSSWNWAHPNGERTTLFRFKNTGRSKIPSRELLGLLGQPQEKHDVLPNRVEQDWVYHCKDGTVTCRIVIISDPLTMTQTKVSGRREF